MRFYLFPNEEVSPLDMLDTRVMLRVIGSSDGRLIIDSKRYWVGRTETKLTKEAAEEDRFLCCFRSRDNLRLAR